VSARDEALRAAGQEHLIDALGRLDGAERAALEAQIDAIDLPQLSRLVEELVHGEPHAAAGALSLPDVVPLPRTAAGHDAETAAAAIGVDTLLAGKLAAVLVAGGQGTRLGFDGPKGAYPFTPSGTILFAHHAATIAAIRATYGCAFPWYVMTSPQNNAATREVFDAHDWFGLPRSTVTLFVQGTMPAVDRESGRILLEAPNRLALSPDGHGGIFRALAQTGLIEDMRGHGVETFLTFQVDNPMLRLARPAFIGYHVRHGSQMSNVVVRKANPDESVGIVAKRNGRTVVVEYSDLPDEVAHARDASGELRFWAGSIAAHAVDLDLAETVLAQGGLPFHRAIKAVPHLDASGMLVTPREPNAVKFESFIFDALPLARASVSVESPREVEFSPIKNAAGEDSPETARRDLNRLYAGWLDDAGIPVPRDGAGEPVVDIEIDPRYARTAAELAERVPPDLPMSDPLVLRER
jgi:UDP-N-acetylglucosamine/UDP-N-acetylgalactosamine diphosphorylase